MDKRWVLIGALVVGVFLFMILLVPFVVNPDTYRSTIETQLSAALGREVTMGKLSFALMEGSLTAEDIVVADDPAFSDVPFIQAKSLAVGIQLLPFLYHHQVRITKIKVNTPSMQLIQHSNGKWNYSSLGRTSSESSFQQPTSVSDFNVGELKIVNGSALVSSVPATAKPFQYSDVNLTVKQLSFLRSCPFELSAKLPGSGTLKLTGDAGPISQKDASQTPFRAKLKLRDFNPVASGLIDASKGISMDNDVDAEITSDGTKLSSTGKVNASRLQLVPNGSPSREPVAVDFSIAQDLLTREGTVSDIAVHSGTAAVHVNGTLKFAPEAMTVSLHLSAPTVPMEQLERLLPVVGVRLPAGSSLQGGTLTASITITGPATAATLAGPVEIDNTRLVGFDLGSRIEGLSRLVGTSSGTDIGILKARVNTSPQGTRLTEIYGEMPQIGTATGDGTVAPAGELDFHLTAKLNSSRAVGPLSGHAIPLTITGTATNPSIRANVGPILHKTVSNDAP
ncbi:MAG TPA: AsmA family protein [Terracidiphilus sp.]|nr:AsmA family protein [Terracidiphilus sp.]